MSSVSTSSEALRIYQNIERQKPSSEVLEQARLAGVLAVAGESRDRLYVYSVGARQDLSVLFQLYGHGSRSADESSQSIARWASEAGTGAFVFYGEEQQTQQIPGQSQGYRNVYVQLTHDDNPAEITEPHLAMTEQAPGQGASRVLFLPLRGLYVAAEKRHLSHVHSAMQIRRNVLALGEAAVVLNEQYSKRKT